MGFAYVFIFVCTATYLTHVGGVTQVIQHPANRTFCEGTTATLSCVIFDNNTGNLADTTSWVNDNTGGGVLDININNTRNGTMVTSILTFESVSLIDNGTYFCIPKHRVQSYFGMILVKGKYVCACYLHTIKWICIYVCTYVHVMSPKTLIQNDNCYY